MSLEVARPVEEFTTDVALEAAVEGLVHQHVTPHAVLGRVGLEADGARVVGPGQQRRSLHRGAQGGLQLLQVRVVLAQEVVHTAQLLGRVWVGEGKGERKTGNKLDNRAKDYHHPTSARPGGEPLPSHFYKGLTRDPASF